MSAHSHHRPSGPPSSGEKQTLPLESAASNLLEECRMVLPGIQALFGFQLIAVFSDGFAERLSHGEQKLHLAAIVLVVIAIALVMAPAAIHRQCEPHSVSEHFLSLSTRLLLWSMLPLVCGMCIDVYLVSHVILGTVSGALVIAGTLLVVFVGLWYVLPRMRGSRRLTSR